MIRVNEHYLKLSSSYLFSEIRKRVEAFQAARPDVEVIKLGIDESSVTEKNGSFFILGLMAEVNNA